MDIFLKIFKWLQRYGTNFFQMFLEFSKFQQSSSKKIILWFLQKFILETPQKSTHGDFFRIFDRRYLRKVCLEFYPEIPSESSSLKYFWEFLQELYLSIALRIHSKDFFRNSLCSILVLLRISYYSRNSFWESLSRNFCRSSLNDPSKV